MVAWLLGSLVAWLVGWLVGSLVAWLVGWLVACLVAWLLGWIWGLGKSLVEQSPAFKRKW